MDPGILSLLSTILYPNQNASKVNNNYTVFKLYLNRKGFQNKPGSITDIDNLGLNYLSYQ